MAASLWKNKTPPRCTRRTAHAHNCQSFRVEMAEYKLVYLDYRGRAELIRFILAHAGVAYDDTRIEPDSWLKYRPGKLHFSNNYHHLLFACSVSRPVTPFGLVPYLEIKSAGITISGNATIARYLGEKYGELVFPSCDRLVVTKQ